MLIAVQAFPGALLARNLHLIDQLPNGFRIYRSGLPTEEDFREFNKLGIEEMAVLSGDARHREFQYSRLAPDLKVVFNEKQSGSEPLTASFLKWFDDWASEARKEGKVIAFRCRCGCHRTGRLAAYYQMKYQNLTAEDAIVIMNQYGVNMFLHPELIPQIRSLEDYIHDRPCSQPEKHCVVEDIAIQTGPRKAFQTPANENSPSAD